MHAVATFGLYSHGAVHYTSLPFIILRHYIAYICTFVRVTISLRNLFAYYASDGMDYIVESPYLVAVEFCTHMHLKFCRIGHFTTLLTYLVHENMIPSLTGDKVSICAETV